MAPRFGSYDKEGLEYITNGFSKENVISDIQLGTVYRARNGRNEPLVVKVWDKDEVDGYPVWPEDKDSRMREESCLTYDDRIQFHPNMIKISGIAWTEFTPSMIYDLDALDTLHNLLDKDSFSWIHRVKAALGIASFIHCLHGCKPLPYLIRNISASHIMLDQDYNAKLYDFSLVSGGILADKTELLNQHLQGCYGYMDPDYVHHGRWSNKCDVFAFGVVLIGLISKRVQTEKNQKTSSEPFLYEWAHNECQKNGPGPKLLASKFSLVHNSLEVEPFFYVRDGIVLTKLAMQCVNYNPTKRPTMKQIFNSIRELSVVQKNADILSPGDIKVVRRFSISELYRSMIKKTKIASDLKQLRTLFKNMLMASEDKLVSSCKGHTNLKIMDWKYVAPNRVSSEAIEDYTSRFSEEKFISVYPFGKLYHGSIDSRNVTVKTWEDVNFHFIKSGDNEIRLRDELILLQHPKFVSHPHIVKMIGYCYENEKLSAVYDLESLDILYNLISKDSFTWHQRIIFMLEFAELLKYLQQRNPPYLSYVLRNIFPEAILVDMNYKPKLFDFSLVLGGIMNDQEHYRSRSIYGWNYFFDPYTNCHDYYTEVSDIYSFGMVMLNLITKICYPESDSDSESDSELEFDDWVWNEFKSAKSKGRRHTNQFSLADSKFHTEADFDPLDGHQITKLAMQCIHRDYLKRPTINQIVRRLKSLKIMSNYKNSG